MKYVCARTGKTHRRMRQGHFSEYSCWGCRAKMVADYDAPLWWKHRKSGKVSVSPLACSNKTREVTA
mgnify:CR=1 FL=1